MKNAKKNYSLGALTIDSISSAESNLISYTFAKLYLLIIDIELLSLSETISD